MKNLSPFSLLKVIGTYLLNYLTSYKIASNESETIIAKKKKAFPVDKKRHIKKLHVLLQSTNNIICMCGWKSICGHCYLSVSKDTNFFLQIELVAAAAHE